MYDIYLGTHARIIAGLWPPNKDALLRAAELRSSIVQMSSGRNAIHIIHIYIYEYMHEGCPHDITCVMGTIMSKAILWL